MEQNGEEDVIMEEQSQRYNGAGFEDGREGP